MTMTFYYTPMTSATRVHWALEELGMPYEKKKLDLAAGDQRKPEYLALNPNGKVPLLVDDGLAIFESLAILLHLGERYGVEKGLFPAAGAKRSDAFRWMTWSTVTFADAFRRILVNTAERIPAEQHNAAQAEVARQDAQKCFAILDAALAGKEYILGGEFSYADLSLAALMPLAMRLGVDSTPYKNVTAWAGRCTARPALARAMQG